MLTACHSRLRTKTCWFRKEFILLPGSVAAERSIRCAEVSTDGKPWRGRLRAMILLDSKSFSLLKARHPRAHFATKPGRLGAMRALLCLDRTSGGRRGRKVGVSADARG